MGGDRADPPGGPPFPEPPGLRLIQGDLLTSARAGLPLEVWDGGAARSDSVYVGDVVSPARAALQGGAPGVCDAGPGRGESVLERAEAITPVVDGRRVETRAHPVRSAPPPGPPRRLRAALDRGGLRHLGLPPPGPARRAAGVPPSPGGGIVLVAVFSDVHGNLPALERFVERTEAEVDAYVCLGDVVNYGPWNDECLEVVLSLPGIVLLEGNHERLFLGTDPIADEIPLVREFFERSFASFSRADLITGLPREHALGRYLCAHTIDDSRVYDDTEIFISKDYIIGHTHHQFMIHRSGHTIINCGSIGQDRKRLDVLNYALYDSATEAVRLCRETYPAGRLLDEMASRGYSQRCLDYFNSKWVGPAGGGPAA